MPGMDGRKADELRPLVITRHFLKHAEGSVLIELGDTKVVCAASIDERVPQWMRGGGRGWGTAEYGMLPRSTHEGSPRETGRPRGRGRSPGGRCASSSPPPLSASWAGRPCST